MDTLTALTAPAVPATDHLTRIAIAYGRAGWAVEWIDASQFRMTLADDPRTGVVFQQREHGALACGPADENPALTIHGGATPDLRARLIREVVDNAGRVVRGHRAVTFRKTFRELRGW